jgi:hypothetical protein
MRIVDADARVCGRRVPAIRPLRSSSPWQALENLRQQQASSLAYFDVFLLLAVVTLAMGPVVFSMKRSVAEKGAHIGGHDGRIAVRSSNCPPQA